MGCFQQVNRIEFIAITLGLV